MLEEIFENDSENFQITAGIFVRQLAALEQISLALPTASVLFSDLKVGLTRDRKIILGFLR
jgi:hypothetical protein